MTIIEIVSTIVILLVVFIGLIIVISVTKSSSKYSRLEEERELKNRKIKEDT